MKSYVPYMGAKTLVAEHLVSLMRAEAKQCFIDLFVGGGSVTFAFAGGRNRIINDFDRDTILMHQAVAADPTSVMAELKRLPVSRPLYTQLKEQRGTAAWWELPDAERAAAMIYLYCCAFNAKLSSTFVASPMTPINFKPEVDLTPYAEHLRGVTFENLHWAELLDRYVMKQKKLQCLVYADPPYVVAAGAGHYGHCFDAVDHVMLTRKLAAINERNGGERAVKIMLTYDDDPGGMIRALYRKEHGWFISPLPIRYGGGHHREFTEELRITNYEVRIKK